MQPSPPVPTLAELPSAWQTDESRETGLSEAVVAEQLPNHRLAYLDYEGLVSGERGTVRRVDAGTFESIVDEGDRCDVALHGALLWGRISLRRRNDTIWSLTVESID